MASSMSYEEASRVSGELFGNLFARNSDEDGYQYALKSLLSGEKSPRLLVREFMTSEEFRELHFMNQSPNEIARRILLKLKSSKRIDPEKVKQTAIRILEGDWRAVMTDAVDSDEYKSSYGEFNVPLWA